MYLESLADFIDFLGQRKHSMDDVLAHLSLRTFAPWSCPSIFIYDLRRHGALELVGSFGFPEDFFTHFPSSLSISQRTPISDAISLGEPIFITTLPKFGKDYLALNGSVKNLGVKSLICQPIEHNGTPCAVIGAFFRSAIHPSKEMSDYLSSVSSLISLYFYQSDIGLPGSNNYARKRALESAESGGKELTQRQLLILRMISEGMTNLAIAEYLRYSESTVRQESIRIYAKLGCLGRHEAARIYREQLTSTSPKSN